MTTLFWKYRSAVVWYENRESFLPDLFVQNKPQMLWESKPSAGGYIGCWSWTRVFPASPAYRWNEETFQWINEFLVRNANRATYGMQTAGTTAWWHRNIENGLIVKKCSEDLPRFGDVFLTTPPKWLHSTCSVFSRSTDFQSCKSKQIQSKENANTKTKWPSAKKNATSQKKQS